MEGISFWFMLIMLIYWVEHSTIKKNTDALVVASKEVELEVNADKS